MTPQNATLDSKRTLSRFVSYRRLSSQLQFSLSVVTLGYLSQWGRAVIAIISLLSQLEHTPQLGL
jgi:hypothetical protein